MYFPVCVCVFPGLVPVSALSTWSIEHTWRPSGQYNPRLCSVPYTVTLTLAEDFDSACFRCEFIFTKCFPSWSFAAHRFLFISSSLLFLFIYSYKSLDCLPGVHFGSWVQTASSLTVKSAILCFPFGITGTGNYGFRRKWHWTQNFSDPVNERARFCITSVYEKTSVSPQEESLAVSDQFVF